MISRAPVPSWWAREGRRKVIHRRLSHTRNSPHIEAVVRKTLRTPAFPAIPYAESPRLMGTRMSRVGCPIFWRPAIEARLIERGRGHRGRGPAGSRPLCFRPGSTALKPLSAAATRPRSQAQ